MLGKTFTAVCATALAVLVLAAVALGLFTEPAVRLLSTHTHGATTPSDETLYLQRADQVRTFVLGVDTAVPLDDEGVDGLDARSVQHLLDVKRVVRLTQLGAVILAGLMLGALVAAIDMQLTAGTARVLRAAGTTVVGVVLALALFGLVSFDAAFTQFHEVLFADGSWTFTADSFLITTFPIGFWMAAAASWALGSFVAGAALWALGVALGKKVRADEFGVRVEHPDDPTYPAAGKV